MADPTNPAYAAWSRPRRVAAAVRKVVEDQWTIVDSAREFGVSRPWLSKKVGEERQAIEAKVARAREILSQRGPRIEENTRVGTFAEFERRYFGHLGCPDCDGQMHEVPDWQIKADEVVTSTAKRKLINVPPFHGKTTRYSIRHTIYDICRDPNSRTIILSKAAPLAEDILGAIKAHLMDEALYDSHNLIGDYGPFYKPGSWSDDHIFVTGRVTSEKDPTVLTMGWTGSLYGRRADKIKFDDVADEQNQANPDQVAKMLKWIDRTALSRIGKTGQAVFIGTRVSSGDIYYHLAKRPGYEVVRFPCVLDETNEEVLWPDHFPYEQALIHRSEMTMADFQLVYQNIDIPGIGASFTEEMLELTKDPLRVLGQYDPMWRMIGGVDLAGGGKDSGYSCLTIIGIDLNTGRRYLVDQYAEKSMKAPDIKDLMLRWSAEYNIYEWRVESNALQSQIIQYDFELVRHLAARGVRVTAHETRGTGRTGKWDAQFGVESIAPQMTAGLYSIPWGNAPTAQRLQPLFDEFISFPMGITSDRVMSLWMAELGARSLFDRAHLPLFSDKFRAPNRIKRKRVLVDFANRKVEPVPMYKQRPGIAAGGRYVVGPIMQPGTVPRVPQELAQPPEEDRRPMNVDPRIWAPPA